MLSIVDLQIVGKCSVTLLSEVETSASYTDRPDAFFYALVYDPHQKSLVADRGEIRIGSGYQATIPHVLEAGESDGRGDGKKDASGVVFEELEERLWVPPTKQTRDSQNGETSNGDTNGDANLEDDDHGNLNLNRAFYCEMYGMIITNSVLHKK